jgi:hypothetical protein
MFQLKHMKQGEMDFLIEQWDVFAHNHQCPPDLAPDGNP